MPIVNPKYVASREKDIEFTRELAKHGMTDSKTLLDRPKETELSPELRKIASLPSISPTPQTDFAESGYRRNAAS